MPTYGCNLLSLVSQVTKIHETYLVGTRRLNEASIAQRMCWASKRTTSRIEDQAYSLLGIFSINMPLLYGERSDAFKRLQEHIITRTSDQSILSWIQIDSIKLPPAPVLAPSPVYFSDSNNLDERTHISAQPHSVSGNILRLRAKLSKSDNVLNFLPWLNDAGLLYKTVYRLKLNYSYTGYEPSCIFLTKESGPADGNVFRRFAARVDDEARLREWEWEEMEEQYIQLRIRSDLVRG